MENNQETILKCMRCGHDLETDNVLTRSDVFPSVEIDSPQDAMVMVAHCPHCGMSYELYDTPDCETDEYEYWKEA